MRILICDKCGGEIYSSDPYQRVEDRQPDSLQEVKVYDICKNCRILLFPRKSKEEVEEEILWELEGKGVL